MKRRVFVMFLAALISIAVTSCSFFSVETYNINQTYSNSNTVVSETPFKGGVIRLFSTTPDTLNPILTQNCYVRDIFKNVFEGLVSIDSEQRPVACLAESWSVSKEGNIWTFKIRKNVKFHDGVPLTAYDAEYTVLKLLDSNIDSIYKTNVENISTVAATGKYTLKMVLKTPFSFTPELMTFPIIPKHAYSDDDFFTMTTESNNKPVGTGPYLFVSATKNEIIFSENTNWWKSDSGSDGKKIPYIKEIDVKVYKNGVSAVKAIKSRNIDVALINTNECGNYFGRYDLTVNKYQNKNFEFVSFNVNNRILNDNKVRQAISYAIDKSKIIGSILPGKAIAAKYPLYANSWLAGTDSIMSVTNLSKAKNLLAQAGWQKSSDGVLYKNINGSYTALRLELLVNSENTTRVRVANKISAQLKAIGIIVTVKTTGWETEKSLIRYKNYDMAVLGWEISPVPDLSFAYSSKEIITGMNVSGYNNLVVDDYLNKILLETNKNKKKQLFSDMLSVISNDMPYVGLYFYNDGVLYSRRVFGDLSPTSWNRLNDLPYWYLNVSENQ